MTRILLIDDEPINHQLVTHALNALGVEMIFANNGLDGITQARASNPDAIITDVMMPDINGYEVTGLLRRESQFAHIPILVLTAQAGLQDKLKAFEAGADDHITKPFDAAELSARMIALLRRAAATRDARPVATKVENARMIAVHSLRGGIGSSTLAINLGVGLASIWPSPTILLDLTMTAGQVAWMLNMPLRRTWSDLARFKLGELDNDAIQSVTNQHESGLFFIPAPTFPGEAEALSKETLASAFQLLGQHFGYIIADLPHDFSEIAIPALDAADVILVVASPDMASIRAVSAALDTYAKLGYPKEKIKLVLNATFPRAGLAKDKVETALGVAFVATIPYVQDLFVEAINYGRPPIFFKTQEPVSALLEDFAFHLSKDVDKREKPQDPSAAWTRVYQRYSERRK
jgi:pilus assembly protein CpaE